MWKNQEGDKAMTRSPKLEMKAMLFAADAHENQVRKYTGEPYIRHPIEVTSILSTYFPDDSIILAAAALHDVIEDCGVIRETLEDVFGHEVAHLVDEVSDKFSDPVHGNRAKRKALEAHRLSHCSIRAQNIKLADFLSNFPSIFFHDQSFAKLYAKEKRYLINLFDPKVNPLLLTRVKNMIEYAEKRFTN
uniref:Phosphohydrolase n=1 Tax=Rhizobium phage LG08 TaxID=3129229 RepID=A0AAU8HYV8_9CAUD